MKSEHWSGIGFFTYVNSPQRIYPVDNKADGNWFIDSVGIVSLQDRFCLQFSQSII